MMTVITCTCWAWLPCRYKLSTAAELEGVWCFACRRLRSQRHRWPWTSSRIAQLSCPKSFSPVLSSSFWRCFWLSPKISVLTNQSSSLMNSEESLRARGRSQNLTEGTTKPPGAVSVPVSVLFFFFLYSIFLYSSLGCRYQQESSFI